MGKLTNFYISFASNQVAIFYPGQVITGSVTAELSAPLEMKCKFSGFNFQILTELVYFVA